MSAIKELGGLSTVLGASFSKTEAGTQILITAFPKLSGAIAAASASAGAGASLFTVLGVAVKSTAAAIWTFLTTNPVGWAILAVAAIASVVKIVDACTESFEEAKDAAEESRNAYESTASEVESLESELETVQSRLKELESMGKLTITEQEEYDRLVAQNEQLERQLEIKQKLAAYQQKEAAEDAENVLNKTQTWATGEYNTVTTADGYTMTIPVYASGDIIDKVTAAQEKLNQKKQQQAEIEEELRSLEPSESKWWQAETDYEIATRRLESVQKEIDGLEESINTDLEEINTQYNSLFDEDGNVLSGFEGTVNRIDELYDLTLQSTEDTSDSMEDATVEVEEYTSSIEKLKESLAGYREYQEQLSSAIESSRSAVGLSDEEISNLLSKYQDLDSFDASKLFEETANGIHLNTEELSRLNEEYSSNVIAEYAAKAKELQKNIYRDRSKGLDTSALESELTEVQLLINSYEGLTSAYNAWLTAKSGGNERDSYESIGASYEEMADILGQGWYGDESLNAYLDLLLSAQQRTGDAAADFKKLSETIDGTSHSIMDYWRYDGDDNLVTDGLFDFLDDVNKKLGDEYAKVNKDGIYEFDFDGDKLQEVADAFGTSTEMVELFERAMIDAGMAVDLGDLTFVEEIQRATEELKKFQEVGKLSSDLDLDFDVDTDSIEDVKSSLDELKSERLKIDAETDPELASELDDLISKVETQYYFRLDAETDGALNEAVWIVEKLKGLTAAPLTVEARAKNQGQVQELATLLSNLPDSVQIAVGIEAENVGSVDAIVNQLNTQPSSIQVPVNFEKGEEPESVSEITGKANYELGTYPTEVPPALGIANFKLGYYPTRLPSITQNVYANRIGFADGTAHANGTVMSMWDNYRSSIGAYSHGRNWSLMRDEDALVNELGTESIVRDGKWFPIPGGAHIAQLKKGDIIFSAEQTKELLKTGRVTSGGGHGKLALADGTAFNTLNLNAYDSGTGGSRRPNSGNSSSKSSYSYNSPAKSSSSTSSKSSSKSEDEFEESIDWIEIALTRIREAIDRIKVIADSAYKTFSKRNSALADEIVYVTKEIDLQQQAYNRYMQEANSVGLSESWAEKVRNGSIDISTITDEDLANQIEQYKEYYEKAIECKDAVAELQEEVAELYETRFDNVATEFDNRLALLEHMTTTFDNGVADLEERGYLASTEYYKAMQDTESEKLKVQKEELNSLINAMSQAVNSGSIKEGSEAWYEMQQEINDTKQAIQESETAMIKFGNSIREVEWGHFDYLQEQISAITSEADFMIDLMSNSDLYTDNGQLTDTGMATMGLHGQNYNVYMAQADKYAEEIKSLNAEIANDPNNTKLLERREELLGLQRESILAAEDEKQAIVDMVEEGINLELESLKSLIDAYTDSLDSAKDLYDYQKKVRDQTSEIAKLQKQISAYKNDTSEENRAVIQKLEVDLANAMEDLEETQYERYISDTKKLLDTLYNEYELILNQRLDNIDFLIGDMINTINTNSVSISETLATESANVGYTLSESMKAIWSNEGGAYSIITTYGEKFNTALTTVNQVLNGIALNVAKMVGESDETAKETVETTTSSTKTDTTVKPVTTTPTEKPKTTTTTTTKTITVGGKINAGSAKIYEYAGDTSGERQYFRNDPIYTVLSEKSGYLKVRHHKLKSGVTGWFKKADVKAYKTGGLVDYTGLAQLDGTPDKPELVLNAEDTKNFISLRDALRSITDGSMSPLNVFGDDDSGFDMAGHVASMESPVGVQTTNIGDITYEINIPIDHVSDYNDFMNQMRKDGKFEKFIQSMTVDRMVGGSKLSKTKFKW